MIKGLIFFGPIFWVPAKKQNSGISRARSKMGQLSGQPSWPPSALLIYYAVWTVNDVLCRSIPSGWIDSIYNEDVVTKFRSPFKTSRVLVYIPDHFPVVNSILIDLDPFWSILINEIVWATKYELGYALRSCQILVVIPTKPSNFILINYVSLVSNLDSFLEN